MKKLKGDEKGFVFVTVALLASLVFAEAVSYLDVTVSQKRLVRSSQNTLEAQSYAEAGLEDAAWEINYHNAAFANNGWNASGAGGVDRAKAFNFTVMVNGVQQVIGSYNVTVVGWNTTNPVITSTGNTQALGASPVTLRAGMSAVPQFSNAISANSYVRLLGGSFTDSYNSASGPYGGINVLTHGSIMTNSNLGAAAIPFPALSMGAAAHIRGDAGTGVGGAIVGGTVEGNTTHDVNNPLPVVVVPADLAALPNSGNLMPPWGGATLNLAPGNYRFGSLAVPNGHTININGNTRIYMSASGGSIGVTGTIHINPGATLTIFSEGAVTLGNWGTPGSGIDNANGSSNPNSFQLFGTPTCLTVNIGDIGNGAGGINFAGIINAPSALLNLYGDSNIYGGVVAQRVVLGPGINPVAMPSIHYDENLLVNGPVRTNPLRLNWVRRIQ